MIFLWITGFDTDVFKEKDGKEVPEEKWVSASMPHCGMEALLV